MSIYVFSLLVGYELSGVDVAIGRRSEYFRNTNTPVKYIFTELPDQYYIDRYIQCGINPEEMLSVHMKLSKADSLAGNYLAEQKIAELKESMQFDKIVSGENAITLYKDGYRVAVLELKKDRRFLSMVVFFNKERLIAKEFYTDRLLYVQHYITANNNGNLYAKLKRTSYVDASGSITCECFHDVEDMYVFPKGERYTKQELLEKFIQELNLTEEDTVLIDRPSYMNFVQPLFEHGNKARIMVFLHSGHYYKRGESPDGLFMNYEYYGWFKLSKYIDTVIVSTEEQKCDLEEKFKGYGCHIPKIEVIPVSGLDEIKYPIEPRKQFSLITVSRLDPRKNIKWMIQSVIKAHEVIPELSLDIYGTGAEVYVNSLKEFVRENQAEAYICFKGRMDVSECYKNYEAYITSSLWETLGLSYMEAVGSGNAMIGLDVRYGSRLFIKNDVNGKLIDFNIDDIQKPDTETETIDKMTNAIIEVFEDKERMKRYQESSYEIAKQFLSDKIRTNWMRLVFL